jgi:hypothetical protein
VMAWLKHERDSWFPSSEKNCYKMPKDLVDWEGNSDLNGFYLITLPSPNPLSSSQSTNLRPLCRLIFKGVAQVVDYCCYCCCFCCHYLFINISNSCFRINQEWDHNSVSSAVHVSTLCFHGQWCNLLCKVCTHLTQPKDSQLLHSPLFWQGNISYFFIILLFLIRQL